MLLDSEKFKRSLKSTYYKDPSPPAIALKRLTSLPSMQIFPQFNTKRQIKRMTPSVFHGQCRYKYLVLGRDTSYFVEKKTTTKKKKKKPL